MVSYSELYECCYILAFKDKHIKIYKENQSKLLLYLKDDNIKNIVDLILYHRYNLIFNIIDYFINILTIDNINYLLNSINMDDYILNYHSNIKKLKLKRKILNKKMKEFRIVITYELRKSNNERELLDLISSYILI